MGLHPMLFLLSIVLLLTRKIHPYQSSDFSYLVLILAAIISLI